jgi:uncharacterized protein YfaS (alpha-2-macroglobulin family)
VCLRHKSRPVSLRAGDLSAIPWLHLEKAAAHTELRSDRFIAAVDRGPDDRAQPQLAYRLRAVSPGIFNHPAASVQDMYRPQRRAWTATGAMEVRPTGSGD